jgi:hypothetical protein
VAHDEHTVWLDPKVMHEIVVRAGLHVVNFYWIDSRFKPPAESEPFRRLANGAPVFLMRVRSLFRRDYAAILSGS